MIIGPTISKVKQKRKEIPEHFLFYLDIFDQKYHLFIYNDQESSMREQIIYNNFESTLNFIQKIKKEYKRKKNTVTIFSNNLHKIYEEVVAKSFKVKHFIFRGKMYNLRVDFKKTNSVLFKNLFKFIHLDDTKHDALYKFTLLLKFYNNINLNFNINISKSRILTLPGLSLSIFRKNYPNNYLLIARLRLREDNFIRKSYFGGRNEIYIPISEHSYYYDINSLYGYIMANNDFPIGRPIKIDILESFNIEAFYGFCEVIVKVIDNGKLPVLPIKLGKDELISYPTGIFKGIYFSEELKLAKKQGTIILKILAAYKFEKQSNLFKEYISKIYNLRLNESNKELKKTYKLLINGLYGRLALSIENQRIIPVSENSEVIVKQTKNFNVAVASAITSLARIYVYKLLEPFQKNLIYWDTDGIFINVKLPECYLEITSSVDSLGKFRLESENLLAVFAGIKFYLYVKKITNKLIYTLSGIEDYKSKTIKTNFYKAIRDASNQDAEYTFVKLILTSNLNNNIIIQNIKRDLYNNRKIIRNEQITYTVPWNINPIKKK